MGQKCKSSLAVPLSHSYSLLTMSRCFGKIIAKLKPEVRVTSKSDLAMSHRFPCNATVPVLTMLSTVCHAVTLGGV